MENTKLTRAEHAKFCNDLITLEGTKVVYITDGPVSSGAAPYTCKCCGNQTRYNVCATGYDQDGPEGRCVMSFQLCGGCQDYFMSCNYAHFL